MRDFRSFAVLLLIAIVCNLLFWPIRVSAACKNIIPLGTDTGISFHSVRVVALGSTFTMRYVLLQPSAGAVRFVTVIVDGQAVTRYSSGAPSLAERTLSLLNLKPGRHTVEATFSPYSEKGAFSLAIEACIDLPGRTTITRWNYTP